MNNNRSKKFWAEVDCQRLHGGGSSSQYNGLLTKAEGGSGGITVHIDRIGTVAVSKKE